MCLWLVKCFKVCGVEYIVCMMYVCLVCMCSVDCIIVCAWFLSFTSLDSHNGLITGESLMPHVTSKCFINVYHTRAQRKKLEESKTLLGHCTMCVCDCWCKIVC